VVPGKWYHHGKVEVTAIFQPVITYITAYPTIANSEKDVFDHEYKPVSEKDRNNW
jgi:hypothetical protein